MLVPKYVCWATPSIEHEALLEARAVEQQPGSTLGRSGRGSHCNHGQPRRRRQPRCARRRRVILVAAGTLSNEKRCEDVHPHTD